MTNAGHKTNLTKGATMSMNPIVTGIVCSIVSILLTFFITTIAQKSIYEEMAKKSTKQHIEAQHNNRSVQDYIDTHVRDCKAPHEIERLKTGIAFLVGQMGGDPKKMGLL